MNDRIPIAIYQFSAWKGFLLPMIFPEAVRVNAFIDEWAEDVLIRLPDGIRFFAFHCNLSYTATIPYKRELLCAELRRRDITPINSLLTNISKSFIQSACCRLGLNTVTASPNGNPDEFLIAKTNLNYGGENEGDVDPKKRQLIGIQSPSAEFQGADRYRIFHRRDLPEVLWTHPDVVVENYISNKDDIFYRIYVLGSRLVISRVTDPAHIKKMPIGIERNSWFVDVARVADSEGAGGNFQPSVPRKDRPTRSISCYLWDKTFRIRRRHRSQREELPDQDAIPHAAAIVLEQVVKFTKAVGVDYCAIDVVVDDEGRPYIVDLNTTPHWGDGGHPELLTFLRHGIEPENVKSGLR